MGVQEFSGSLVAIIPDVCIAILQLAELFAFVCHLGYGLLPS